MGGLVVAAWLTRLRRQTRTIPWNLFLISLGSAVFAVGLKAVALPQEFVSGGMSGLCLLIFYWTQWLSPGIWYFLINVPIFAIGWLFISRRFFFYSIFGMLVLSLAIDQIRFVIPVHDPMLAAIAGGVLIGTGAGITLHSLGSSGGNDIIAVLLNQKFNIRMGSFFFAFNLLLFGFSLGVLDVDRVLYSLVMSFVTAQMLDYVLTIFNQRKIVFIISEASDRIAAAINERLRRGGTFLYGRGTYTRKQRKIVMTVLNNFELKRLEEIVFDLDPEAFVIIERTFNVLGRGFSRRKVY
jgi:uncharacterized membrane-anchored protein YitT (DUF2179 family)